MPDALNPCEDVMGSQWLRTSVWIVVFLAVVGNVAVLVVLFSNWLVLNKYKKKLIILFPNIFQFLILNPTHAHIHIICNLYTVCRRDVTVQKFLMSNLAFADLSLGLYLLLIAAIDVHSMGEYFNFGYDWQYGK